MKTKVRRLENISEMAVPVEVSPSTILYLRKGDVLENRDIYNLDAIQEYVKVEQDLTEVPIINEDRKILLD